MTTALSAAGATPVKECKYAFGIDSITTFIATSQLLEDVGVAAYQGAAPSIASDAYLAAALSIHAVENKHSTWVLSAADSKDGFPRAYQAALDFNQVYSIAAPLFTSCPSDSPALPFKAFPALTVSTMGPYSVGQKISFSTKASGAKYAAFITATGAEYISISGNSGELTIPEGITGQSYLILTKDKSSTKDSNTVAGPAVLYVPVQATEFPY